MLALLWLTFALFLGWHLIRRMTAARSVSIWLQRISPNGAGWQDSPLFCGLFHLAGAIWAGLLPLTWLTYGLAYAIHERYTGDINPMLFANLAILLPGTALMIYRLLRRLRHRPLRVKSGQPKPLRRQIRQLTSHGGGWFIAALIIWMIGAGWLMGSTFGLSGPYIRAAYSVFSDFAPHTALVRSFSHGMNFPTEYPHFAGDGISYHFLFYFLAGNLHFLGLPISWAINLPSWLGLLSFSLLLGTLAVQLTGKAVLYLLSPAMFFLRSSLAFWTHLRDWLNQQALISSHYPPSLPTPRQWLDMLWHQSSFIGSTPHDDWGLWGINVFANQRHLLPGLSVMLLVFILMLPDLIDWQRQRPVWQEHLASRHAWLPVGPDDRRRALFALLLTVMLPYFHGSATIALLLLLAGIALLGRNRLMLMLIGSAAIISALIQTAFFSSPGRQILHPTLLWGFIAEDKSLTGVLSYLLEMSGLLLPLLIVALLLNDQVRRRVYLVFLLPLLFGLTVSVTPDVTVNHKYLLITFALISLPVGDLLVRLWQIGLDTRLRRRRGHQLARQQKLVGDVAADQPERFRFHFDGRLPALLLAIILMITGLMEIRIVQNINQRDLFINPESEMVEWIETQTDPDAVFVTAPHHFHEFYLSGRLSWFGHAYYAWSAGHDTAKREELYRWFLAGGDGDLTRFQATIRGYHLDYLLIDDTLRRHPDFVLDEAWFQQHYQVAAEFPASDHAVIYRLQ